MFGSRGNRWCSRFERVTSLWLAAAVCACGDDEASENAEPPEPPEIRIASITASGNQRWLEGQPLQVGCDLTLVVEIGGRLDDWIFSAPGGCTGSVQCGFVALRINPSGDTEALEARSATPFISVDLEPLAAVSGRHQLQAELRRTDGSPFLVEEQPVSHRLEVELVEPSGCEPPGMGGAGGIGGSGSQAGAGGLGGGGTGG
jgi:hypothetical protein